MTVTRKIGGHRLMLGHGLAIVCAVCGLGLIVAAPLDSVVYGIVLFGVAVAIDIIVAVHCPDSHHDRRRASNRRSRVLHTRKRQPARR
jgi:hypothetical protein